MLTTTDIGSRDKPTWNRNKTFPFSTFNFDYASTWLVSTLAALLLTWILAFFMRSCGVELFTKTHHWDFMKLYAVSDYFYCFVLTLKALTLFLEFSFWTHWFTEFAQQCWAATFYDEGELAKQLLSMKHPSVLITLPTHIPTFVVGVFCLLLHLFWNGSQNNWLLRISGAMIIEPSVRLSLQYMIQGYGVAVFDFFRFKVFRPNPIRWMILSGILLATILTGLRAISYGEQFDHI